REPSIIQNQNRRSSIPSKSRSFVSLISSIEFTRVLEEEVHRNWMRTRVLEEEVHRNMIRYSISYVFIFIAESDIL
ncbi:unnamed protein product, partial [Arabidopsis halleri]